MPRPKAISRVVVDGERVLAPKSACASILGAPPSWLSSLKVPAARDDLYDLAVISRKFVAYREGVVKRLHSREAKRGDAIKDQRLLKIKLENEKLELANAESRGELVDKAAMGLVVQRAMTAFKKQLEVVPRKMASRGLSTDHERLLQGFIDDALRELSGVGGDSGG